MDAFLQDVNPSLVESIKKDIPETPLLNFVQQYKGPDTKEDRLHALIPFLNLLASSSQRRFGPGNRQRKKILEILGHVHCDLQEWPVAASTWKTIVDTDDEVTLSNHPQRDLTAMINLGIALDHTKQYPQAEEVLMRVLPMLEVVKKFGRSSSQYLGCLSLLMLAVGKQGRVEEAHKLYVDYIDIASHFSEPEYSAYMEVAKAALLEGEQDSMET